MAVAGLELKPCSEESAFTCLQSALPQSLACSLTPLKGLKLSMPCQQGLQALSDAGLRVSSTALASLFKYKSY